MEIIALVILTLSNIVCFVLGAGVMQKAQRNEKIALPAFDGFRDKSAKKEAQLEKERVETILRNIDSFDGTAFGQEDVPGR